MEKLTVEPTGIIPSRNSLYITLQILRTQNGRRQYHWALYNTGNETPRGHLIHATDNGRQALDLYREIRVVSDARKSSSLAACLKIANSPGIKALDACSRDDRVHEVDPRYLPSGEPRWTCRVWVKEVLNALHSQGYIQLPRSIYDIEQCCIQMADSSMETEGSEKVFNDLGWLTSLRTTRPTPIEIDQTGQYSTGRRYQGTTPMDIDSTGGRYYGPKPMIT